MPSDRSPDPHGLVGTMVRHYQILERLGGGGMGDVYRAHDTRLDRIVALKFLTVGLHGDPAAQVRFLAEARAASALDHPNICTVHEIGEAEGGRVYIAMSCYEGETLKERIARGAVPIGEAVDYAIQMARGLAKAHGRGITHRDIKPANIMVTPEGVAKILDFGTAKVGDVQLTQTGQTIGTFAYMSPEQAEGSDVDRRADLWSLGAVLWEMLTGEPPYTGATPAAIIYALLSKEPVVLPEPERPLPRDLVSVVSRCLEKDRARRYQSAEDLVHDLESLGFPAGTPRPGDRRRGRTSWARSVGTVAAAALVLLLAGVVGLPGWRRAVFGGGAGVEAAPTYLAVLPVSFSDPATEALAAGLTQTLTGTAARLGAVDTAFWVVPAAEVLAQGVTSPSMAHRLFSVNRVLAATIQGSESGSRLVLELVAPDPLRQLASASIAGPQDPAFQRRVSQTLLEFFGASADTEAETRLAQERTTTGMAYTYYLEGVGYLRRQYDSDALDDAVDLFERALLEDSLYAPAHAGLCEATWEKFVVTGDANLAGAAIESCDRAEVLADEEPSVMVALASVYLGTGQHPKAMSALDAVLRLEPDNADAYRWMGRVYEDQGLVDEAAESYWRAIELKPGAWINYRELGIVLTYAGRQEEAAAQFEQLLRLTPDNAEALSSLAYTRLMMNDEAEAERLYRASLEMERNALGYRNLGFLFLRKKDWDRVVREIEAGADVTATDPWSWRWLGHAHHWAGRPEQSAQAFRRVIELARPLHEVNPRDADVLSLLAEAHVALGQQAEGRAYLQQLVSVPLKWNYLPYFAGRTFEMLGDRESALRYIRISLQNGYDPLTLELDPWLDGLRADPAYRDILDSI